MCVSVICGTAAGGLTFAFVLRIAKVFTSWSDMRLMPDIVGTHFLFEAAGEVYFLLSTAKNLDNSAPARTGRQSVVSAAAGSQAVRKGAARPSLPPALDVI